MGWFFFVLFIIAIVVALYLLYQWTQNKAMMMAGIGNSFEGGIPYEGDRGTDFVNRAKRTSIPMSRKPVNPGVLNGTLYQRPPSGLRAPTIAGMDLTPASVDIPSVGSTFGTQGVLSKWQ